MPWIVYKIYIARYKKMIGQIVQFFIGFTALLLAFGCVEYIFAYNNNARALMGGDYVHMNVEIDAGISIGANSDKFIKTYQNVWDELYEKNDEVLGVAQFETVYTYKDEENGYLHDNKMQVLNEECLRMTKWKLEEGDINELLEYSGEDIVPVLISNTLKNEYKIGETYNQLYDDDRKISFIVVGILDEDFQYLKDGSTYSLPETIDTKGYFIAPKFKEIEYDVAVSHNTYLRLKDNTDNHFLREKIDELTDEDMYPITFSNVEEGISMYYESTKVIYMGLAIFACLLLLMSLIGNVGIVLADVTVRIKEFGIYYSQGLRQKDIMGIVILEMMSSFVISFLLSTLLAVVSEKLLLHDICLINFKAIFYSFAVMVLCILLSSIAPILKMRKYSPIDLIRGVNGNE